MFERIAKILTSTLRSTSRELIPRYPIVSFQICPISGDITTSISVNTKSYKIEAEYFTSFLRSPGFIVNRLIRDTLVLDGRYAHLHHVDKFNWLMLMRVSVEADNEVREMAENLGYDLDEVVRVSVEKQINVIRNEFQ